MINSQTLLSNVIYGEPSGRYDGSSQDWTSTAAKAADYYQGRGGIQSVNFSVTGFVGTIVLEATLDTDSDSATWFNVLEFDDSTAQRSEPVIGNFTWIRARIQSFDAGTIDSVVVTY